MKLETNKLGEFEFLVSIVIWYEMVYAVNLVSKSLMSIDMLIDITIEKVRGLVEFFLSIEILVFSNALETLRKIAIEIGVDPIFKEKF